MKTYYIKRGLPIKKCIICGKDFQTTGTNQKCCFKKYCKKENKNKILRLKYKKNKKIIYINCKQCNKKFIYNYYNRKYCCKICFKNSLKIFKPKEKTKCSFCGKIFEKQNSRQKYCSHKCRREPNVLLRFEILKRDNFTCQYCGRKAPEVILHIDHKIPKSKGGTNEKNNLITACADCNLGKSNNNLNQMYA